ncbi:uncharacterized protein LOC122029233 [Zingiber officinale]|uniref:uncharacterized protein LOC122029233 n=1 Tax=Zingiber officinale TaxID=94328 RepID=UPI001C4DADFB|nr:uncharacterized protein LOC122029233 [Zingiber officinale]
MRTESVGPGGKWIKCDVCLAELQVSGECRPGNSRSSVNIIYKRAFKKLQIDRSELLPMMTLLYGFTGNKVLSIGQTKLAISLSKEPLKRARITNFIVVDTPLAYNVILGRLALNKFRAVVSTYFQKIKVPVDNKVGEVKGDQLAAGRCYAEMVRSKARTARKNPCLEVNAIIEKPPTLVYEEKEEVQIHPSQLEATAFIAADLENEKKPGNKWWVCINFRDLNKTCQKDFYPLPRIDKMVDSTTGCDLICMLDAYQGCNQVSLAKDNQEKVSFITTDGTFCYNVMLFVLKNTDTTYQRLMNKVFRKQIDRNLEVYIDDILIKSI